MNPEQVLEQFLTWLSDATFVPAAALAVVLLTALLKRIPQLRNIHAGVIALTVQVVLWVAYMLAKRYGVEEPTIVSAFEALTTVLTTLSMIVLGSGATQLMYDWAKTRHVPLIGQERDPKVR